MANIALVTGRGGSKRLPGKNVRSLAGKPLIAWSVEAGLQARSIHRVIVSTDDAAIAEAANRAGAETPFMRPEHLSGDHASHAGVIAHALDWYLETEGDDPEFMCLLQPTSPLRTGADIDALMALVQESGADCGVAMSPARVHPAYMYSLTDDHRAKPFLPPASGYQRSQDLEPAYFVNGAAYVLRPETFRKRNTVLSSDLIAYVMPEERSIDIDEERDFARAEEAMRKRLARSHD